MKVLITRTRVMQIVAGAAALKSLSGIKLAYAVSKNITALRREQDTIKDAMPKVKDLEKYNEEYGLILDQEARKDENGNFIPTGGGNVAIANYTNYTEKLKALEKKYAKPLKEQSKANEDFDKFLKEPFEFEFFQFEETYLPETVTVEQMDLLVEMIKETNE